MDQEIEVRVYYKVLKSWYNNTTRRKRILIECECGNIKEKDSSHVSAGCLTCGNGCPISKKLKSQMRKGISLTSLMLPAGVTGFRRLFDMYKRRAKKFSRDFSLTEDEFRSLTKSNCYYCGEPPSMVYIHKEKNSTEQAKENGKYIYNSVDRIDSGLGYTVENSRPCCKICNTMKLNHSEEDFVEHIKKVYEHFAKYY